MAERWLVAWLLAVAFALLCLALRAYLPWLATFPREWTLPVAAAINMVVDTAVPLVQPFFRAVSAVLDWPMRQLRDLLVWIPWPATMLAVSAFALRVSGLRLAIFAVAAMAYIVVAGFWPQAMSTLSLVMLAVPMSVILGFALGVLGHRYRRFRSILLAALDVMQTVPAFAYLIPLLILFGFGPVVGLIASAIYATPPMVRNTMLGLDEVPEAIRESGVMSGCTPRQRFWFVEAPTALPQILVGINQSTMAALSMIIVAAIIGGFEDIGWEVLSSMRKAEFGQSILSGLVIALLAILIDRLTLSLARNRSSEGVDAPWITGRQLTACIIAAVLAALVVRAIWGDAAAAPQLGLRSQVSIVNQWLLGFVRDYGWFFDSVKNATLYSLLLPMRVGISGAATPAIWGVAMTPLLTIGYALAAAVLTLLAARHLGWRAAIAMAVVLLFLYCGVLGMPWPAFIVIATLFAWQASGTGLAFFVAAGFVLILVSGLWTPLGQSLYLCILAVTLCSLVGGALGVWASRSDRVSAILRPICDALQTMPQFVFLIPALMFFKVGEFTALIAIMLYAIVPPIRYVEHGLRNVPADVTDSVRQMGATQWQSLWHARLPLAAPSILLGLNQTIMASLSMLAIAALVGTRDLGQQVYVALGKADAGMGLVAGLSIAFLGIAADRCLNALAGSRSGSFGTPAP